MIKTINSIYSPFQLICVSPARGFLIIYVQSINEHYGKGRESGIHVGVRLDCWRSNENNSFVLRKHLERKITDLIGNKLQTNSEMKLLMKLESRFVVNMDMQTFWESVGRFLEKWKFYWVLSLGESREIEREE